MGWPCRYEVRLPRSVRPGRRHVLSRSALLGSEEDYGTGVWRRSGFDRLATRLRTLKDRFLLSINDRPEVRRSFEGFHLEEVETVCTIASKAGAPPTVPELLIGDRTTDVVQKS